MFDNREEVRAVKVAVIGTGTLGTTIAQVFSQCDRIGRVYICKGRQSSREGKEIVARALDILVDRKKMERQAADGYLEKIYDGDLDNAADVDFVIEAVAEDLDIKRMVFKGLESICKKECIFATNTSSLPIKEIADGMKRPLIGMHFFNPAPVMKLVEVIISATTPPGITEFVVSIAKDIGKTPIVVKEAPGFVVNRVLIPMINEAISIYAEGIASVEDIDIAMKLGANQPMGPLALGDLIGLDVVLAILNVMLRETGDNRYLPQPMLKKMVRERKLGRKTGEGFYKY